MFWVQAKYLGCGSGFPGISERKGSEFKSNLSLSSSLSDLGCVFHMSQQVSLTGRWYWYKSHHPVALLLPPPLCHFVHSDQGLQVHLKGLFESCFGTESCWTSAVPSLSHRDKSILLRMLFDSRLGSMSPFL